MPSKKLLLVCLSSLLSSCKSAKTKFEDGKGRVSVSPQSGEDVCFFEIDNESGRNSLQISKDEPICDGLVSFGLQNASTQEYLEIFCLVELKGRELERAIEQILNTHHHVWELLADGSCKPILGRIVKKAYIYQHGSAPKQTKQLAKLKDQLKDIFGNNWKIARDSDLGSFLRK